MVNAWMKHYAAWRSNNKEFMKKHKVTEWPKEARKTYTPVAKNDKKSKGSSRKASRRSRSRSRSKDKKSKRKKSRKASKRSRKRSKSKGKKSRRNKRGGGVPYFDNPGTLGNQSV